MSVQEYAIAAGAASEEPKGALSRKWYASGQSAPIRYPDAVATLYLDEDYPVLAGDAARRDIFSRKLRADISGLVGADGEDLHVIGLHRSEESHGFGAGKVLADIYFVPTKAEGAEGSNQNGEARPDLIQVVLSTDRRYVCNVTRP